MQDRARRATYDDLDYIMEQAEAFVDASTYGGMVFEPARARWHLTTYIDEPCRDILIVPGGGALIAASYEVLARPFCYIIKFWIEPAHRRSTSSRVLLYSCVEWAKGHDCSHIFCTATAGLDEREQQLFVNLMTRHGGMTACGPVLAKEL